MNMEEKKDWLTTETMLYGGLGVAACSLVATVVYFCISRMKAMRLNVQLDAEYGSRK